MRSLFINNGFYRLLFLLFLRVPCDLGWVYMKWLSRRIGVSKNTPFCLIFLAGCGLYQSLHILLKCDLLNDLLLL